VPEIVQLLASPVHRYEGRPVDGPAPAPPDELVDEIRVRAGLGIVGDRYFGSPAHQDASVTVIAQESLPPGADLTQVRRNILVSGIAVDDLIGSVLILDSGDGPVRLHVKRRANPCAWMDVVIAPGAWRALRGKGGVRCRPLDDGILRVGPVQFTVRNADEDRQNADGDASGSENG
jgi:MOSC domain-containing protein YiiM